MSAAGTSNRARPRRTLDSLINEHEGASKGRQQIIRKHWSRSVSAMLADLLSEVPDEVVRPMQLEYVRRRFVGELKVWWAEPFVEDAKLTRADEQPQGDARVHDGAVIKVLMDLGAFDVSKGLDPNQNHTLMRAWLEYVTAAAWMAAWKERHRSGEGDGRPEVPSLAGVKVPSSHWENEDYQYIMTWEMRSLQYRLRNAEWFKKSDINHKPIPMELAFHQPLMSKMMSGEEPIPTPPPGQDPIRMPVGPNGRKMIRHIVMDEKDDLGCILREQTEAEAELERRSTTWTIGSWYDPPGTVTPREHMRPFLEGTEHEYLLEQYADYLIQYDRPD